MSTSSALLIDGAYFLESCENSDVDALKSFLPLNIDDTFVVDSDPRANIEIESQLVEKRKGWHDKLRESKATVRLASMKVEHGRHRQSGADGLIVAQLAILLASNRSVVLLTGDADIMPPLRLLVDTYVPPPAPGKERDAPAVTIFGFGHSCSQAIFTLDDYAEGAVAVRSISADHFDVQTALRACIPRSVPTATTAHGLQVCGRLKPDGALCRRVILGDGGCWQHLSLPRQPLAAAPMCGRPRTNGVLCRRPTRDGGPCAYHRDGPKCGYVCPSGLPCARPAKDGGLCGQHRVAQAPTQAAPSAPGGLSCVGGAASLDARPRSRSGSSGSGAASRGSAQPAPLPRRTVSVSDNRQPSPSRPPTPTLSSSSSSTSTSSSSAPSPMRGEPFELCRHNCCTERAMLNQLCVFHCSAPAAPRAPPQSIAPTLSSMALSGFCEKLALDVEDVDQASNAKAKGVATVEDRIEFREGVQSLTLADLGRDSGYGKITIDVGRGKQTGQCIGGGAMGIHANDDVDASTDGCDDDASVSPVTAAALSFPPTHRVPHPPTGYQWDDAPTTLKSKAGLYLPTRPFDHYTKSRRRPMSVRRTRRVARRRPRGWARGRGGLVL